MKQLVQKKPCVFSPVWLLLACCGGGGAHLWWGEQAIAQSALAPQSAPRLVNQYNFLFVNPQSGDDAKTGGEQTPLRTIARALATAAPNTMIILAPGTYSSATGETFPLQLKPGTTIQGDPRTRGQAVVITGGGFFLSRSFARQNVTIVGANRAGLTGVTVSNPHPQGYGLWIESTNPVIVDSTFTGSDHDGVSIVGNSAPILRNNYFYQNGANGITIYGTSRPVLQDNIFEQTGFGINVAQKAAPRLINNRITQNKDGIVVQGNAQPVLRHNLIDGNDRDGLVAIGQSRPNLGTAAEPGNNTFQNNRQFDINAQVNQQTLSAFGNQLIATRTTGKIDFSGNVLPPLAPIATRPPALLLALTGRKRPEPSAAPAINIPVPAPAATMIAPVASQREVTFSRPSAPTALVRPLSAAAAQRPSASPLPAGLPMLGSVRRLPALAQRSRDLTVPTEPLAAPDNWLARPLVARPSSDVLPVPGSTVPIGNVGDMPSVAIWRNPQSTGNPPAPTPASGLELRYRVVVDARSAAQQAQVRTIAPAAFISNASGRSTMQAGAFSDRAKADQLREILTNQGLSARVENR